MFKKLTEGQVQEGVEDSYICILGTIKVASDAPTDALVAPVTPAAGHRNGTCDAHRLEGHSTSICCPPSMAHLMPPHLPSRTPCTNAVRLPQLATAPAGGVPVRPDEQPDRRGVLLPEFNVKSFTVQCLMCMAVK